MNRNRTNRLRHESLASIAKADSSIEVPNPRAGVPDAPSAGAGEHYCSASPRRRTWSSNKPRLSHCRSATGSPTRSSRFSGTRSVRLTWAFVPLPSSPPSSASASNRLEALFQAQDDDQAAPLWGRHVRTPRLGANAGFSGRRRFRPGDPARRFASDQPARATSGRRCATSRSIRAESVA